MKKNPNNTTRSNAESAEPLLSHETNPQGQKPSPTPAADKSTLVFTYSRKDALADGFQMDVSDTAREAGFRIPVFITEAVFSQYVKVPEGVNGQDEAGRLWDILWMLHYAIKQSKPEVTRLPFQLHVRNDNDKPRLVTLHAECSALDINAPSPSITVMMPNED